MDTAHIISMLDQEIARLSKVKALLEDSAATANKRGPGSPRKTKAASSKKRYGLSAAGRAKIAAAQKARWAKLKKS